MTIKATEVGKIFRYSTKFDMSSETELTLKLTNPDGTETILTSTGGRVTAPASPVTDPDLGSLLASEYMQITTIATDFPVGGAWSVCGIYEDATPKTFIGNTATFTIGDAC
jgi:hypothetical protein